MSRDEGEGAAEPEAGGEEDIGKGWQRLDAWLWCARFVKTKALARLLVGKGRLRINRQPTAKAHARLRPGDVLTFPLGAHVRVIRVVALAARRGPAAAARLLYQDLEPPRGGGESSQEAAPGTATPPLAQG
ncbi:MAG: RNA-binding S4 domain-containing protein [Alphaproteobacteria bacterium]|nr:RNA-binding S4 domain-containing protein [Alphaproteobacteria bacterium]